MKEELGRTAMLLGEDGLRRLRESRVAVFGLGGVGGHAAEALARSGVGHLELVDRDTVSLSNINRQLFALHSTVGMLKTEAAAARIRDIDPEIEVRTYPSSSARTPPPSLTSPATTTWWTRWTPCPPSWSW